MICRRQRNGQIGTAKQRAEIERNGWVVRAYERRPDGSERWVYGEDCDPERTDGCVMTPEGQQ